MSASTDTPHAASLTLRTATRADGARIWQLVEESGVLEPNTCYAYLLLSSHFADTCVVAERDGQLLGFVAAYRPPTHPTSVFVWQIGVRAEARGLGLGKRLLHALVALPGCRDVSHLEATVAPSNIPSQRLFEGFAREQGVPCERSRGFVAEDFGGLDHEAEPLLRIGPLQSDRNE